MSKKAIVVVFAVVLVFALLVGILATPQGTPPPGPTRDEAIPENAVKMMPEDDLFIPVVHGSEWVQPVPMPGPVNTAGAEDSPFITPDGQRFFFFWTPDMNIPLQQQILDGVTGIWWCQMVGGEWTEPEKIALHDDLSMEGAEVVQGDLMWFASVRAGNIGEVDVYSTEFSNGVWGNVQNLGEQMNGEYDIGEFHLMPEGNVLYFDKKDASGNTDIWKTVRSGDSWSMPELVSNINSALNESRPFLTADGGEMWFTRESGLGYAGPAVMRSIWNSSGWGDPQEIISNFAGEPTVDEEGNVYFVHHFYDGVSHLYEADIYVAYRNGTGSEHTESQSIALGLSAYGSMLAIAGTSGSVRRRGRSP